MLTAHCRTYGDPRPNGLVSRGGCRGGRLELTVHPYLPRAWSALVALAPGKSGVQGGTPLAHNQFTSLPNLFCRQPQSAQGVRMAQTSADTRTHSKSVHDSAARPCVTLSLKRLPTAVPPHPCNCPRQGRCSSWPQPCHYPDMLVLGVPQTRRNMQRPVRPVALESVRQLQ